MEELLKELKLDDRGLVPAITQDYLTGEVLMLAYMNEEALQKTLETRRMHYWSRSRGKLWLKGETSGHFQNVRDIRLDCDGDTLLFKVEQVEAACHTGKRSCFYRTLGESGKLIEKAGEDVFDRSGVLREVYEVIKDRAVNPKEGSYTNYLFEKGLDKILKKVGEEAAEVIIAAKNESRAEIKYETADLLYHLLVLMAEREMDPNEVYEELTERR